MALLAHREFNWQSFIRKTSSRLLVGFFERDDIFQRVANATKATMMAQVPAIVGKHQAAGKNVLEVARCVHDMASDRGVAQLQAACIGTPLETELLGLGGHDVAMTCYLRDKDLFWRVWAICGIEGLEQWYTYVGDPSVPPDLSRDALDRVASDLKRAFAKLNLGRNCRVSYYDMQERTILEVSHEDRVRAHQRFKGGGITTQWWHPVIHAAATYDHTCGRLKVRPPRKNTRYLEAYVHSIGRRLFGRAEHFSELGFALDLRRLCQVETLRLDPEHGRGPVEVASLSFFSPVGRPDVAIQLTLGPGQDVRDALAGLHVDPDEAVVTKASLVFKFPGSGNQGRRTVHLETPAITNLNDSEIDREVERYLTKWGILRVEEPVAAGAEAVGRVGRPAPGGQLTLKPTRG
jgi:hypothetical protein